MEIDHVGLTVAGLWNDWTERGDELGALVRDLAAQLLSPPVDVVGRLVGTEVQRATRQAMDGVELLAFEHAAGAEPSAVTKPGAVHIGVRVPDLDTAVAAAISDSAEEIGQAVQIGELVHRFVRYPDGLIVEFLAPPAQDD
ncbi:hypothetical protein AB0M48_30120 [Lentzea sp. NPDC051208]|uniref:hypothetical protein n=1 Tax=Lentzea sp. NPDC051208 TaxID=3154642 RepID=UPI00343C7638